MSRVKHSHIVPEFYLEYFSDLQGKIYVFDKPNFFEFPSKPNKVAKLNGFYDLDEISNRSLKQNIEARLGLIESETAPVYKDLLQRIENKRFTGIPKQERTVLSKFIISQMMRTQASRNLIEQTEIEFKRQLKEKVSAKDYESLISEMIKIDPKNLQLYMLSPKFKEETDELSNRIWVIHNNKTKFKFCTSDHPVCTHNHGDFFKTEHEIFLPLNPRLMLSILIPEHFPDYTSWNNKLLDLNNPECSKWYNCVMIYNSERQVYNSELDFRFVRKILREDPQYAELNKPRIGKPDYH